MNPVSAKSATSCPLHTLAALKEHQRSWATDRGLQVTRDQLPTCAENLSQPLSASAHATFSKGKGSELNGKMRALHSSSALVVNVFDYWTDHSREPLRKAIGIDATIIGLEFEFTPQWPLTTIPPHLDVILWFDNDQIAAVESKFTEWLLPKSTEFGKTYFTSSPRWTKCGLPKCQALVESIRDEREVFRHLDAVQLLKHSLGMSTQFRDQWSLLYLYYDFEDTAATLHRAEIERFSHHVGDEVRFRAITYQKLFEGLKMECGIAITGPIASIWRDGTSSTDRPTHAISSVRWLKEVGALQFAHMGTRFGYPDHGFPLVLFNNLLQLCRHWRSAKFSQRQTPSHRLTLPYRGSSNTCFFGMIAIGCGEDRERLWFAVTFT